MESGVMKKVSAGGVKTAVNLPTGTCASGSHVDGVNADLSVHCTADSGGGGGSTYDPLDQTVMQQDTIFNRFENISPFNWYLAGSNCSGASGTAYDAASPFSTIKLVSGGDHNLCVWDWPHETGNGNGMFDFMSGSTPLSLDLRATIRHLDQNGDFWVGMMSWGGTEFLGCRYSKSANLWQAAIVNGGSDVASASTGVAFSAGVHHVKVTNAANSITCSVDGTSMPVSGTIPVPTGGDPGSWVFIVGVIQRGSTPSTFGTGRVSFKVSGIPGAH
jgi:hypothetical protein